MPKFYKMESIKQFFMPRALCHISGLSEHKIEDCFNISVVT